MISFLTKLSGLLILSYSKGSTGLKLNLTVNVNMQSTKTLTPFHDMHFPKVPHCEILFFFFLNKNKNEKPYCESFPIEWSHLYLGKRRGLLYEQVHPEEITGTRALLAEHTGGFSHIRTGVRFGKAFQATAGHFRYHSLLATP